MSSPDLSPIPGGPGWHIDAMTLLPVLDDETVFRGSYAGDPALNAVILLWTGHPKDAEMLLRLSPESQTVRFRALLLDCARDQGRHEDAAAGYRALLAEVVGAPREVEIRQHLGKALFVAENFEDAAEHFAQCVQLRQRRGDGPDLIASSQRALVRARNCAKENHK